DQKEMESGDQPDDDSGNNPFPETDVDEMRAVRDVALTRYVQEMERKQEMMAKMNARNS
ncbi:hypothetical protein LTR94_037430, partial [Friedmanniomyces endolithicus]